MRGLHFFEMYIELDSANIRDFDILAFLMGSLWMSLTSPATLEHLQFNILFRGHINDFSSHRFIENLCDADAWSHLDSIATLPACSLLKRVEINTDYHFWCNDYREVLDQNVV